MGKTHLRVLLGNDGPMYARKTQTETHSAVYSYSADAGVRMHAEKSACIHTCLKTHLRVLS